MSAMPQHAGPVVPYEQAFAFATLVATGSRGEVARALDDLGPDELRGLAVALALHVEMRESPYGPEAVCDDAIDRSAAAFGVPRTAVCSGDRHRTVADARAVAMTAARRIGLTLPEIAAHFGRDHTVVMYSVAKVDSTPRLDAACRQITGQIATRLGPTTGVSDAPEALQRTALDRVDSRAGPDPVGAGGSGMRSGIGR